MKYSLNLAALSHRDFRRYITANAFSLHGVWMQRITVAWIAWAMSGTAAYVGWIAFLGFAPTMITGPIFGVLSDRLPLRRAAMMAQGGLGVMSALLLLCHLTGMLGPISLSLIALGTGIIISANNPVRMSLTPLLVPKEEITSVILASSLNFNLARVVGPALGGLIIAHFGITAALITICLFFAPAILILPGISPRNREAAANAKEPIWQSLKDGAAFAANHPLIAHVLSITALYTFTGRGILEILPVIADGVFQRGATGLGTLTAAAGCGALLSAAAVTLLPKAQAGERPRLGHWAGIVGLTLVVVLGQSQSWTVSMIIVGILGACSAQFGVAMQSTLQLVLVDTYRGRVMSLWVMLGIGAASLGALVLGAMADVLGLGLATLLINGAALICFIALLRKG